MQAKSQNWVNYIGIYITNLFYNKILQIFIDNIETVKIIEYNFLWFWSTKQRNKILSCEG